MCDLCDTHFRSSGSAEAADYQLGGMLTLIDEYKGSGFTGLQTPSANLKESEAWATAGFFGWPGGSASPPAGDRSNCVPTCPAAYKGGAFRVHWVPSPSLLDAGGGWF
jgi:hypothetical protein